MKTEPPSGRSNLLACGVALLAAVVSVASGFHWATDKQERLLHSAAPDFCDAKLHGVALIREALSRPDTLVLFGSSELIPNVPFKGVDFFAEAPTGFSIFPVGKAGTSALSVLQKLGAAGEELAGKKLVLSLSPSFFLAEQVDPKYFEGNSSKLQLKELLWSEKFSGALKRDIARAIIKYPKVLDGEWILEVAMEAVADGGPLSQTILALLKPYAMCDLFVARLQDHFEAAFALNDPNYLPAANPFQVKRGSALNWDDLFRKAEQHSKALGAKSAPRPPKVTRAKGTWDNQFMASVRKAQEWRDFELVLRLLREAGANPLVLSMPLHADLLEAQGVSEVGREEYGTRLQQLVGKYGVPFVYFKDHESDPVFFVDQFDHIGSKGWWYYNKAIDDFYHDRLRPKQITANADRIY
jgi:D-alanine transfer protein